MGEGGGAGDMQAQMGLLLKCYGEKRSSSVKKKKKKCYYRRKTKCMIVFSDILEAV